MTVLLRLSCATAAECETIWDAMVGVMNVAVFWMLVMVVLTAAVSTALYAYHGGDWPKGGNSA